MFKVTKKEEPQFFKDFKRKNKIVNWSDYTPEIKSRLKDYMFEEEQGYNCPYCELVITKENSQIEHIKPKDKFPNSLSDYSNYLVGCQNKNTCGQYKGNKWSENFINPTLENPTDYLTYDIMTGKIIPVAKDGIKYKKAIETIEILNLNEKRLCEMRKIFILECENTIKYLKNKEEISDFLDIYSEFPTLKEYLKNF